MKLPAWLQQELAATGAQVAARDLSRQEATTRIRNLILEKRDRSFDLGVTAEFAGRSLDSWLRARKSSAGGVPEAQSDLFPDLPMRLYVRPSTTKPLILMTAHDWDMAHNMLRNRTEGAEKSAKADWAAFKAAYDKVRPLLTGADTTTADVIPQLEAAATAPPPTT